MKNPQIHIRLTPHLKKLLLKRSSEYGLTPAQYTKYLLVKDLGAHLIDLNIKSLSERTGLLNEVFEEKEVTF